MNEPTAQEIEEEAKRSNPSLFEMAKNKWSLDLSARQHLLAAHQAAEDRLRAKRGLPLKYTEV